MAGQVGLVDDEVKRVPVAGVSPRRLLFLAAVASLAGACGGSLPVEPKPARAPTMAEVTPSRWLRSTRHASLGPKVPAGRLLLVGGRRVLVAKDGTVREEAETPADPLLALFEAPTARGPRLLGLGEQGLVRFDDPLGAPRLLASPEPNKIWTRAGVGPGVVALWNVEPDRVARFVDAETGAPAAGPVPPTLLAVALAFRSMREGEALLMPQGHAVTTDGGATWRLLPEAEIDRRMGSRRAHAEPGEPALVRWVDVAASDPRAIAIEHGAPFAEGEELIAQRGLVATVDMATGAVRDLADLPIARAAGPASAWPCAAARARRKVWIACPEAGPRDREGRPGLGIFSVDVGAKLSAVPALERIGQRADRTMFRRSTSGGVALDGVPCEEGEKGIACVLQPDGAWKTVPAPAFRFEGSGALADGRLAVLPVGGGREPPHLALLDPAGQIVDLPPLPVPEGPSSWGRVGDEGFDEGPDGVIRLLLSHGGGSRRTVSAVAQPIDGREGRVTPLSWYATLGTASLRGRFGAVWGGHQGHQVSRDGGETWSRLRVPPWVSGMNARVSAAGALFDEGLLLGWGPDAAVPEPMKSARREPAEAPAPAEPPSRRLSCKTTGPGPGRGYRPGDPLIGFALAPKGPGRAEVEHTLDPALAPGQLLARAADANSSRPTAWTLSWIDPEEVGPRVRSWSGAPPPGASWGWVVESVTADGGRALFVLRTAEGTHVLALVTPRGAAFARLPGAHAPKAFAIGAADDGFPVAWVEGDSGPGSPAAPRLMVWPKGEAPREVARPFEHDDAVEPALAAPEPTLLRFLVRARDTWAVTGSLSIPTSPAAPPPRVPLAGLARADALIAAPASLRPCAPEVQGATVRLPITVSLEGEVDRKPVTFVGTYFVRIGGAQACVERLAMEVRPAGGTEGDATLRVDFARKRGDLGGQYGTKAMLRRAVCTLELRR